MKNIVTEQEFVRRSKIIHKNKYNYDNLNYINTRTKVSILCPKHGYFLQTPENHMNGQGCINCWRENRSAIRKGRKRQSKKIYNFGVLDILSKDERGKSLKSYKVWTSMLVRCYSDKYHQKEPSYIGCRVCEDWLYFSNFKKWFDKNYIDGYELDKDIVGGKENKIYSPQTCCFVPKFINNIVVNHKIDRNLPTGVYLVHNKYQVYLREKGKQKFFGTYSSLEEARKVSSQEWFRYRNSIIEEYYSKGYINNHIYSTLKQILNETK